MSLTREDAEILLSAGFLESEVWGFANAKTQDGKDQPIIDISTPVWRNVIKSRRNWTMDKVNKEWSPEEIRNVIESYYAKDEKRTPWDFLKAEYRDPKKVDYYAAMGKRIKENIREDFGGYR